MKNLLGKSVLGLVLSICLAPAILASYSTAKDDDVLLSTMQQELQRAHDSLGKLDPAPYFLSYSVQDQNAGFAFASQGSLLSSTFVRRRSADVVVRIGTPALDNAHGENRTSAISSGTLPLEDDRNAIARVLWRLTSEEYRKASRAYANVKTSNQVHAQEEDTSPDFSEESPRTHSDYGTFGTLPEQRTLNELVRQYSSNFRKYPEVYTSIVLATVERTLASYVSSEGTHLVTPSAMARVMSRPKLALTTAWS